MKYVKQVRQVSLSSVILLCMINGFAQPEKLYRDLPVGEYAVGFQIISITDSTRVTKPEWNYLGEKNEGSRYRQFTVHLWYPAVSEPAKSSLRVSHYTYNNLLQATNGSLPEAAKNSRSEIIRASIERWFGKPGDGDWQRFLQTSMLATADGKPVPQKFPLLIGMLRPFSTSVINEVLASNGYVVAMVSNPDFSSFSTAALGQVPDMQLAIHQLRHRFDGSRIGVFGFSGAGFVPVLFSMFDQRVRAVADLESGIYMTGLHQDLSRSNYYVPAKLRIPFLHIFSRDLARQETHLDELEQKTKFSKRYRLLLNQPSLHHWDFATEGYASATMLNLRGRQEANIKRSFEITTLYLLHFFNAELKGTEQSRKFLIAKPALPGIPDSLWSITTLQPARPAPTADEFDYIIRKKGIHEALAIVKETLPNDSITNLRQGFVLNNLGYVFLREKKYAEAIGVFQLNTELHPGEANFFDSLSEAYETAGNSKEMKHAARQVLDLLAKKTALSDAEKALKEQALKRTGINSDTTGQILLPPKRAHHELVYDETTQTILLTAGSTPLNGGQSFAFYNDLWSFDGTKWKQLENAGDQRSGVRMAFDTKRKKLFSFGGFANNKSLSDFRVLENGEWKTISNDTAMKAAEPGFVYDEHRDKLIAFGGSAGREHVNNTTWEWDGKKWTKFQGEGPEGRQGFAMVYDSRRKKTIVFGGIDAAGKSFTDDIWEFDGFRWEKITNKAAGPGPRLAPGYAYDSKKGVLLIFGGISNGEMKGDTWEWDGKNWKKLADTGPSPRVMGYMAYDKKRDKVVLFGGRPKWPNDVNDTWEWDGKEWRELK